MPDLGPSFSKGRCTLMRINNYKDFNGPIIWSADGLSYQDLAKIVKDPRFPNGEVAVKFDRLMTEHHDFKHLEGVREFQEDYGVAVFDDAKITEIPNKVQAIAGYHIEIASPFMLNAQGGICSNGYYPGCDAEKAELEAAKREGREPKFTYDALYYFAELCKKHSVRPCVVSVLTSKTPELIRLEYNKEPAEAVMFYATLSANCGITDFVCSPKEIEIVKPLGFTLNTPGIRKAGDSAHDQARIDSPYGAITRAGSATNIRLVIGRSIWDAEKQEPHEAVYDNIARILEEINQAKTDLSHIE